MSPLASRNSPDRESPNHEARSLSESGPFVLVRVPQAACLTPGRLTPEPGAYFRCTGSIRSAVGVYLFIGVVLRRMCPRVPQTSPSTPDGVRPSQMANGDPESSVNDGSPVSLVGPTLNRYVGVQRRYRHCVIFVIRYRRIRRRTDPCPRNLTPTSGRGPSEPHRRPRPPRIRRPEEGARLPVSIRVLDANPLRPSPLRVLAEYALYDRPPARLQVPNRVP